MAVTIKNIAKWACVAHATVSRALHGSPMFSAETTGKIKNIVAALGYQPSVAARILKTNRSQVLGGIVSHIEDHFLVKICGLSMKPLSEAAAVCLSRPRSAAWSGCSPSYRPCAPTASVGSLFHPPHAAPFIPACCAKMPVQLW